jgi:hypothetical protein
VCEREIEVTSDWRNEKQAIEKVESKTFKNRMTVSTRKDQTDMFGHAI